NDPVINAQRPDAVDGAVLGDGLFVLRFFAEDGNDRLLFVNLDIDCSVSPAPEPLLASPHRLTWRALWSSEDPRYGVPVAAPRHAKMRAGGLFRAKPDFCSSPDTHESNRS